MWWGTEGGQQAVSPESLHLCSWKSRLPERHIPTCSPSTCYSHHLLRSPIVSRRPSPSLFLIRLRSAPSPACTAMGILFTTKPLATWPLQPASAGPPSGVSRRRHRLRNSSPSPNNRAPQFQIALLSTFPLHLTHPQDLIENSCVKTPKHARPKTHPMCR